MKRKVSQLKVANSENEFRLKSMRFIKCNYVANVEQNKMLYIKCCNNPKETQNITLILTVETPNYFLTVETPIYFLLNNLPILILPAARVFNVFLTSGPVWFPEGRLSSIRTLLRNQWYLRLRVRIPLVYCTTNNTENFSCIHFC